MPPTRLATAASSVAAALMLTLSGCSTDEPAGDESAAPASWPQTVQNVESGVVRIVAEGCEKDSEGTGFLVAEDLVLTAGHVIDESAAIEVDVAGTSTEAQILGVAPNADVALLRIETPVDGHVFVGAGADPVLADEVAALGYPVGLELTFTQGRVSGLDRTVGTETFEASGFIQTDAAINPGNSGGPLVNIDGEVMGVVSAKVDWTDDVDTQRPVEGTAFAAPATRAFTLTDKWVEADEEVEFVDCEEPMSSVSMTINADAAEATEIGEALQAHGENINSGEYAAAFDLFTPTMAERTGGLELWSQSLQSSFWRSLTVRDVEVEGDTAVARVALRSEQDALDGYEGQTCSDWLIDYTLIQEDGWQVDAVEGVGTPEAC